MEGKATAVGISADSLLGDTSLVADIAISDLASVVGQKSESRLGGNDQVFNHAQVTATANAAAQVTGIGMTLDGEAVAKAESTADGRAGAIDLGGGDDSLTNTGRLEATATADAWSTNLVVGVTGGSSDSKTKSKTSAEGSATANATAVGLVADGLVGDTTTDGALTVESDHRCHRR